MIRPLIREHTRVLFAFYFKIDYLFLVATYL